MGLRLKGLGSGFDTGAEMQTILISREADDQPSQTLWNHSV